VNTGLVEENYRNAILGLVSSPLLSGIEQSLQRALGLDTITLDYRFNQPSVEIGEYIGDKIYISYRRVLGSSAGARLNPTDRTYTFRIEYRLKSGFQVAVEQSGIKEGQSEQRVTVEKTWRF
jgi:hypothetical protein